MCAVNFINSKSFEGIPPENRPYLWLIWSGALTLKEKHPPNYYDMMVEEGNGEKDKKEMRKRDERDERG